MPMEQTVKERLKAFIRYKELSVNKFEKACSLSQGFVKNIGKSIGTDSIVKQKSEIVGKTPNYFRYISFVKRLKTNQ